MSEGVLPLFAAATIELSEVWDEDSGAKQYVVVKVYGEEVHRRRADSDLLHESSSLLRSLFSSLTPGEGK